LVQVKLQLLLLNGSRLQGYQSASLISFANEEESEKKTILSFSGEVIAHYLSAHRHYCGELRVNRAHVNGVRHGLAASNLDRRDDHRIKIIKISM
jgi:hypothetical protein